MAVAIQAVFKKAGTTVDGGWNIQFDCGEHMANEVVEASKLKDEALFVIVMTETEYYTKQGESSGAKNSTRR